MPRKNDETANTTTPIETSSHSAETGTEPQKKRRPSAKKAVPADAVTETATHPPADTPPKKRRTASPKTPPSDVTPPTSDIDKPNENTPRKRSPLPPPSAFHSAVDDILSTPIVAPKRLLLKDLPKNQQPVLQYNPQQHTDSEPPRHDPETGQFLARTLPNETRIPYTIEKHWPELKKNISPEALGALNPDFTHRLLRTKGLDSAYRHYIHDPQRFNIPNFEGDRATPLHSLSPEILASHPLPPDPTKPSAITRQSLSRVLNHLRAHQINAKQHPTPQPLAAPEPVSTWHAVGEDVMSVEAIFAYIFEPITPFVIDDEPDSTHGKRVFAYTASHCDRIVSLLIRWASFLPAADSGVRGGPDSDPIQKLLFQRFTHALEIDFEAALQQGITLPDLHLMRRYQLDTIDIFILWIVAALQINPLFRDTLLQVWNLGNIVYISQATLMRFVCVTQLERSLLIHRTSPSSPLMAADFLRTIYSRGPTSALYFEIVAADQIIQAFAGTTTVSFMTSAYAELQYPSLSEDVFLPPEHERTLTIIRNFIARPPLNEHHFLRPNNLDYVPSLAFLLEGLPGSGRNTLIKIIASRLETPLIVVQCAPLATIPQTEFEDYMRDLFLDAELLGAIICLRNPKNLLTDERMAAHLMRQLARRSVVCAISVDLAQTVLPILDPYMTFKAKMTADLKDNAIAYWKPHLRLPQADESHLDIHALTEKLALQPFQIQKATKLAYYATDATLTTHDTPQEELKNIPLTNQRLESAAGEQVSKNIGNLAFISDPEVTLEDVIVNDDIMSKLKQIIGSAQNRRRVLYDWGLSSRIRRGTGVIALFDGDPGTGKTHSAEAIARALGLSLMRINIATMVDKYIGETEKNLTTIFEQARPDMSLLLFDEADSLFTKRTANVTKSNDRYSNMSVNVLLQLVERYEGVSILTTNLKNAIDPAFERRITYKVYFPMPKKEERVRLWRYMCPPTIKTAEPIEYEWLAELEMSGGEIKNAVLTAAFRAATMGRLLNSEILYDAGVSEASAAGRVTRRYSDEQDDLF